MTTHILYCIRMLYYGNNVTFQYVGYESVTRPGKKKNKIKKKNKKIKKIIMSQNIIIKKIVF